MDFNKTLSTLTFVGLAGLVLYNFRAANSLLNTLGSVANNYIGTVRGERAGLVS